MITEKNLNRHIKRAKNEDKKKRYRENHIRIFGLPKLKKLIDNQMVNGELQQ